MSFRPGTTLLSSGSPPGLCQLTTHLPLPALGRSYTNKEVFQKVHQQSAPYLEFKASQPSWRAARGVEVAGQSYNEAGVGHMQRP